MFFSFHSPFTFQRKNQFFLKVAITTTCLALYSATSMAQVSVNHSALNNLGAKKKEKTEIKKSKKSKKHDSKKKATKTTHSEQPANDKIAEKPKVILPTIPNAPPPVPIFKDADIVVPLHPPTPPAMPPTVPTAKGEAKVTPKHTIITFNGDSDALNESMMKATMDVADMLKQHPNTRIFLNAYSHGASDDPSTPRRIALNRGLALRAILINQGIPSTRIYLLAKGVPQNQESEYGFDYVELIRSDLMPSKPTAVQKK